MNFLGHLFRLLFGIAGDFLKVCEKDRLVDGVLEREEYVIVLILGGGIH